MNRRTFIKSTAAGAAWAAGSAGHAPVVWAKGPIIKWRLATSWPEQLPILQTGVHQFAQQVALMTRGRLIIDVHCAGKPVKALDVFEAVSSGDYQCGHSAAYYWAEKIPAAQWFTTVPFGLKAPDMNTWYYAAGGQSLWEETYAPFHVLPILAGNTGIQMGGWFNREIHRTTDFQGLRMRMPGLGGRVVERLGAKVVLLPAGDIVQALKEDRINAAEWIGPYHDMVMGFHEVVKYYYAPGWHEPGTAFELICHRPAFNRLPSQYQAIVRSAAADLNLRIFSDFEHRNRLAMLAIAKARTVQLRLFPHKVLRALERTAREVLNEEAAKDPMAKRVHAAFIDFKREMRRFALLRGAEIRI